jgi:PIN domain nuclease of toxin-antitoxin system
LLSLTRRHATQTRQLSFLNLLGDPLDRCSERACRERSLIGTRLRMG